MKKSLIALAALGAFAGSALAQSSVTLYGIVDLGIYKANRADSTGSLGGGVVSPTNKELNVAQATRSRLGFRGVEDLGGGLSIKFDIEHRFLPDTGATGSTFWDKSIVGITSQSFGEVTLGRDYMPAFYPQYLLDPWLNQGLAELGGGSYAFAGYVNPTLSVGSARYNNGIFYKMAANGFTVMAAASLSEAEDVDNRYGFNVMYNAGPLMVAAAYDQAPSPLADETNDVFVLGGAYDFGFVKPRLSYTRSSINLPVIGEINPVAIMVSATFPVGTNLIKVGYAQLDADDSFMGSDETKQRKFSLGYEHVLSKRTALYANLTNGKTKGAETVNAIETGIRHAF